MISRKWTKEFLPIFILCLGVLSLLGCSDLPPKKAKVSGPWVQDSLAGKSKAAKVDNGSFTKDGWCPGSNGSLTYDLPGLSQGVIKFDVKGLNRNGRDTIFLTMFEKPELNYPDPYILNNPYRVALTLKNFDKSPQIPFQLLWTIKNFPAATPEDQRYVKGMPAGVDGIEKTVDSSSMPVFPEQTYHISLTWKFGIAQLSIDGKVVAEINYQPNIYDGNGVRVILGKSPGMENFDLPNIVISNVVINFAEL